MVVGEIDGAIRDRTRAMFGLCQQFELDAILTDDIWGYLWGKIGYGAMLFATALNHDSMTQNFAAPAKMPAWLALGREVVAVALAKGITPRGFGGYAPMAFAPGRPDADAIAVIHWLREFTSQSAKTHSGIWRDLAVRKRKTESGAQLGIVPALAAELGIPTPALSAVGRLIADIEEGRREQSPETFAALLDAIA
jgi:2-dehydropantoate 2-reductase